MYVIHNAFVINTDVYFRKCDLSSLLVQLFVCGSLHVKDRFLSRDK